MKATLQPFALLPIALGYGLDDRGFESRRGMVIFLFTTASTTALGPTQLPSQWISGALSLGVKRPGRELDHSPASSAEVKNAWSYIPLPQYSFMAWCSVKHRHNFTFTLPLYFTLVFFLSVSWNRNPFCSGCVSPTTLIQSVIAQSFKQLTTGWKTGIQFPVRVVIFFFSWPRPSVPWCSPILLCMGTGLQSLGLKRLECEADRLVSRLRMRDALSTLHPPPHVTHKHGSSFAFTVVRGCIQKFPDWPPGAKTANGTALCH
jgi:hypothetical protein